MEVDQKAILVIDDSASVRKFIRMLLENSGFKVYEASDGEEGLNVFNRLKNIDLIITDIYMPKKTGLDVVIELKKKNSNVKTIVLTDGGNKNFSDKSGICEALGASYFIKKDMIKDNLINLVNKILSE